MGELIWESLHTISSVFWRGKVSTRFRVCSGGGKSPHDFECVYGRVDVGKPPHDFECVLARKSLYTISSAF